MPDTEEPETVRTTGPEDEEGREGKKEHLTMSQVWENNKYWQ